MSGWSQELNAGCWITSIFVFYFPQKTKKHLENEDNQNKVKTQKIESISGKKQGRKILASRTINKKDKKG